MTIGPLNLTHHINKQTPIVTPPPPNPIHGKLPATFLLWLHVRINPIYHTAYLYSICLNYVPQVSFRDASSLRQVCFRSTSGLIQLRLMSSSGLCHICFRHAINLPHVFCRFPDCFRIPLRIGTVLGNGCAILKQYSFSHVSQSFYLDVQSFYLAP